MTYLATSTNEGGEGFVSLRAFVLLLKNKGSCGKPINVHLRIQVCQSKNSIYNLHQAIFPPKIGILQQSLSPRFSSHFRGKSCCCTANMYRKPLLHCKVAICCIAKCQITHNYPSPIEPIPYAASDQGQIPRA